MVHWRFSEAICYDRSQNRKGGQTRRVRQRQNKHRGAAPQLSLRQQPRSLYFVLILILKNNN